MKSLFDFKKMKRNENIISFLKPIFTWRLLYVSLIMVFLYNIGVLIFTDSSINVCGDIKKVYKEEGCGCSDIVEYNYYAYVISENKEVHNLSITEVTYDEFISNNKYYYCGEKYRSNYYWCLGLAIALGTIILIWTHDININESWTYKTNGK